MRVRLVPPVVRYQPARVSQECTTIPHRSHRSLERRRNKVASCCCTAWVVERVKGMGPSSPNGPASHPGNKGHQRNLDSDLATIHPSPFPECTKCNTPTSRLRPNLCRSQYLLTPLLYPSPPSRTHPGNTRSWLNNNIIAALHPSLIRRSCKNLAAGDKDTFPPVDITGLPVKVRSGRSARPEVPRPHTNTISPALNKEFFKLAGNWLNGGIKSTLPLDGDVAATHWPLWSEIW